MEEGKQTFLHDGLKQYTESLEKYLFSKISEFITVADEPVIIFRHCAHLKIGYQFYVLLNVLSDRDDTVPLKTQCTRLKPSQLVFFIQYIPIKYGCTYTVTDGHLMK